MKPLKTAILLTILWALTACQAPNKQGPSEPENDCIEVYYLHNKHQCSSCLATEKETLAAIEEFKAGAQTDKVIYKKVDISEPENEALGAWFEATYTSVFLVTWHQGKSTVVDLSNEAFADALSNAPRYRALVVDALNLQYQNIIE